MDQAAKYLTKGKISMKNLKLLTIIAIFSFLPFLASIALNQIAYGQGATEKSEGQAVKKGPSAKTATEKVSDKMTVKKGDKVKVEYTGSLSDGTVFGKSEAGEPLEFSVGGDRIIPGFDEAVEGMKLNEEKKVTIKSDEAYGKRDETLVKVFPLNTLPENFKPEKGMTIRLQDQSGRSVPGTITEITKDNISIDLNHPLAGKELTFKIKVVGIN